MTLKKSKKIDRPLSEKQRPVIDALATGSTDIQAAARVGVTIGTVKKWKTMDAFETALNETKSRGGELVRRQELELYALLAVREFKRALRDPSPRIRLRAAEAILKWNAMARANDDLEERYELKRRHLI
jgi:hypothetical protein